MRFFAAAGAVGCSALLWAAAATAQQPTGTVLDLTTAVAMALESDPSFAAAQARAAEAQEQVPRARAALLPSVSGQAYVARNALSQTVESDTVGSGATTRLRYPSEVYAIELRQPLLRAGDWAQLDLAQAQAEGAQARLSFERQQLVVQVASLYFGVLLALEQVRLSAAEKAAFEATLSAAERLFAAGTLTRTDVADARARRDLAVANLVDAENVLVRARRQLESRLGQPVHALAQLDAEKLLLAGPTPARIEAWIDLALAGNPEIAAAQRAVEAARQDVRRQRAQHLPTVDLVATGQRNRNETVSQIDLDNTVGTVGLRVTLPIYSGGGIESAVAQAQARLRQAEAEQAAARLDVETSVREQFDLIRQGVEAVRAFEAAVLSAGESVAGTERGVRAGTRTGVDLLNAESRDFEARRALARARIGYVLAQLRLRAAAGELDKAALAAVNRWLGAAVRIVER